MTHLVIFDLDGTLVDAFGDIQAAVNAMLADRGHPTHDLATIRGFVGNGVVRLVERSLPPEGRPHLDDAVAFVRKYYAEHPADHAVFYTGAAACLGRLRGAGRNLAVLSNKPEENCQLVARHLGLDAMVDRIMGERRDFPIKPDPAGVLLLKKEFAADRVTFVGDGLPDAEVAMNAGAEFIGVEWGLATREELSKYGRVAAEFRDVVEMVLGEAPARLQTGSN